MISMSACDIITITHRDNCVVHYRHYQVFPLLHSPSMYMYVCMYVCMYVYTHTYACIHL